MMKSTRAIGCILIALLSTAAIASPIDQKPLLNTIRPLEDTPPSPPPLKTISQDLFYEFEELSRIVDIAYCVGNSGIQSPFSCLSRCEDFPSFELVQEWCTGPLATDSTGYIALSHPPAPKRILVVFRGTYSLSNVIIDLSTSQQTYIPYRVPGAPEEKCENCAVHDGFYAAWKDANRTIGETVSYLVEEWAPKGYRLEVVGHSLGGAVAALAGLDYASRQWNPKITTFGEPRLGNRELADFVKRFFNETTFRRITHTSDPVPHLPFDKWGFSPHDFEYFIMKKGLPPSVEDVLLCTDGPMDARCIAGESTNAFELFSSHRDYFNRVGLCLPKNFFRLPWQGDDSL